MAEYADREHYIPLRKSDLVELLCADQGLTAEERQQFRQLSQLLSSLFHYEYHQKLEDMKDEYAFFDPDAVTKSVRPANAAAKEKKLDQLFERFTWLMERANFQRLDRQAIESAMNEVSAWGLNMEVDFNVFERLEVFCRGQTTGTRSLRRWWRFWQRQETIKVPIYQRLVLILKLRPHKRLGPEVDTSGVFLKLFKDIPRMDLEMLLPGARMQMPGLARGKLGASLASALGWIGYKVYLDLHILATALLTLNPFAFWGPLSLVVGYGYKQYYGYQFAKQTYSLQLTQSLYFQNLDNNAGVLYHLLDEAEEQECREALLAYYYLWRHANQNGWTSSILDDYVELDLERLANIKVDFEIGDALHKLERLNLVMANGNCYRAQPIGRALEILDERWDNIFPYHQAKI